MGRYQYCARRYQKSSGRVPYPSHSPAHSADATGTAGHLCRRRCRDKSAIARPVGFPHRAPYGPRWLRSCRPHCRHPLRCVKDRLPAPCPAPSATAAHPKHLQKPLESDTLERGDSPPKAPRIPSGWPESGRECRGFEYCPPQSRRHEKTAALANPERYWPHTAALATPSPVGCACAALPRAQAARPELPAYQRPAHTTPALELAQAVAWG